MAPMRWRALRSKVDATAGLSARGVALPGLVWFLLSRSHGLRRGLWLCRPRWGLGRLAIWGGDTGGALRHAQRGNGATRKQPIAHSPVGLKGAWSMQEDAVFFLRWIDELIELTRNEPGRVKTEDERRALINLYGRARRFYQDKAR